MQGRERHLSRLRLALYSASRFKIGLFCYPTVLVALFGSISPQFKVLDATLTVAQALLGYDNISRAGVRSLCL